MEITFSGAQTRELKFDTAISVLFEIIV